MKSILIIKFWALGDILMTTPLLRTLKNQWPECRITWIADSGYADILRHNPLVDELVAFDAGAWRRDWRCGRLVSYLRTSLALRQRTKNGKFDCVINLTADKWWSVWMLTAPVRIGLLPRRPLRWLARRHTHSLAWTEGHNTRRYLRAAQALGIPGPYDEHMALSVPETDREAVQAFLRAEVGYDDRKPIIILHPGTSQPSKCWPSEHFASLAASLGMDYNIVVTGSLKEQALAEAIVNQMLPGAHLPMVAAGRLEGICQTVALASLSAAVVTGDTSLLHIASALDVPVVGIYGSSRPDDNAPLFGPHALLYDTTVPCAPCYEARCPLAGEAHLRCQHAIVPKQVRDALGTLLRDLSSQTSAPLPLENSHELSQN